MADLKNSPQHQEQRSESFAGKIEFFAVLLFLGIALSIFIPIVAVFIAPLISAIVLTVLFFPIYEWLQKRLWHIAPLSSLLTLLLFIIILLIPAYVLFQVVVFRLIEIFQTVEPLIEGLFKKGSESSLGRWFLESPLGDMLSIKGIDWYAVAQNTLGQVAQIGTRILQRTTAGLFGFLIDILIILFTMFYLLMNGKNFVSHARFLIPMHQEYKNIIFDSLLNVSRATIKGTLIVGIIQGVVGAFTLLIFGIKGWILWGVVMMVIAVVPMLGPPIILIPAGIYKIAIGQIWQGVGILFSSFVIVSAIDYIIRPRIVGKSAHIHDLVIFFSSIGGLVIFGIWGFIIGPAVSALVMAALDIYRKRNNSLLMQFMNSSDSGDIDKPEETNNQTT